MNLTEFLEELKKTRNGWEHRPHCNKACDSYVLRKKTRQSNEYCPVTAVCVRARRVRFEPWEFEAAAKAMGMTSKLANRIVGQRTMLAKTDYAPGS